MYLVTSHLSQCTFSGPCEREWYFSVYMLSGLSLSF